MTDQPGEHDESGEHDQSGELHKDAAPESYADEPAHDDGPSQDTAPESYGDEPAPDHTDADATDDQAPPASLAGDDADPRIAAAVARLDALGDSPPAEHVEVYEDVHRVLQDALADAARGSEQGQPGGPRQ